MNDWNNKGYALSGSNCIDLVHAVAGSVGMAKPGRSSTQTPTDYVSALKSMN